MDRAPDSRHGNEPGLSGALPNGNRNENRSSRTDHRREALQPLCRDDCRSPDHREGTPYTAQLVVPGTEGSLCPLWSVDGDSHGHGRTGSSRIFSLPKGCWRRRAQARRFAPTKLSNWFGPSSVSPASLSHASGGSPPERWSRCIRSASSCPCSIPRASRRWWARWFKKLSGMPTRAGRKPCSNGTR